MKLYLLQCSRCVIQNTDNSIWDNKILLLVLSAIIGIFGSIITTIITEKLRRKQIIHSGITTLIETLEDKKQNYKKKLSVPTLDFYTEKKITKKKLNNSLETIMRHQYDDSTSAEEDIDEIITSLKNIKNIQFKLKKA